MRKKQPKRFAAPILVALVLPVLAVSCNGMSTRETPAPQPARAALAPPRPKAEEVRAVLAKALKSPERWEVSEHVEEGKPRDENVVIWNRSYDGIEVQNQPRSALVDGAWVLRKHRDLAEPEPPRRESFIALEVARAAAKLPAENLRARLVYKPEYKEEAKVPHPRNAADVELVITGYRLAYELSHRYDLVWVDAYTGEVIERTSRLRRETIDVAGRNLVPLTINITPVGNTHMLRDPDRSSLMNDNGTIRNGQGIAAGSPEDTVDPVSYRNVEGSDPVLYDAAFALEQSWDFFNVAFQRRGLRNLQASTTSIHNDYIIALSAPTNQLGLANDPAKGLIFVNDTGALWQIPLTISGIGHEWSHAVFFHDVNATPSETGTTAGLNEANSFFFAILIRKRALAVWSVQQVCQQNPGFCTPTEPIVELSDPERDWKYEGENGQSEPDWRKYHLCLPSGSFGAHPPPENIPLDRWIPGSEGLDGHRLAGPINRMQCLLVRGMLPLGSTGDLDLKDPVVPNGFAGLGAEKVARIWWGAIHLLHGYSDPLTFFNAREAMLKVAEGPTGADRYSLDYKAIEDAFAAVWVGAAADRDAPLVPAPPLLSKPVRPGATIDFSVTDTNGITLLAFVLDDPMGTPIQELSAPPGGVLSPPFRVTLPATTTEGQHTLFVVVEDARKNRKVYSFDFFADATPPTLTVTDKSGVFSPERSPMRVFAFHASDDKGLGKARILVDGADTTGPSSGNLGLVGPTLYTYEGQTSIDQPEEWVNLKGSEAGPHVVAVEVSDVAGNTTTEELPPWTRDTTAPSICVVAVTRGTPWSSVSLLATARDAESSMDTIKYKVDGITVWSELGIITAPGASFDKTITTTLQTPGTHMFTAQCVDQQGNAVTSPTMTLTVGPPPSCVLTTSVDPTNWARVVMAVTSVSANLTLDQVRYDVDGVILGADSNLGRGPGVLYTGTRTSGTLAAGTHNFQARCIDDVGQTTLSNVATRTLAPPVAPCTATDGAYWNEGGPGPATLFYELGRASGHFRFDYGWLSNGSMYTVSCAAGGTINGSSSYSTGCARFDAGFPNPTSGSVNLGFSCNSGRITVNASVCNVGSNWQVEPFCATP